MDNIKNYIESGILESYVLGFLNEQECLELQAFAKENDLIKEELNKIGESLELYAQNSSIKPDATIKAFLLATIDFTERLKQGEIPGTPPLLNESSSAEDYKTWTNLSSFTVPVDFDGLFAKIINADQAVTTAVVWIKEMAPQEIHKHEYEKFLILEGTCTIDIEGQKNDLCTGDYLSIPLCKNHFVKVTSNVPCKVILQRIAA